MAVTYRVAPDERLVYLTTTGESSFAQWRDAVLSELFSAEHQCHTAATAEEAVERLDSHEYDVIVTDISMPGMGR